MRSSHWVVGILACLPCIVMGCKGSGDLYQEVPIILEGDSAAIAAIEQILRDNPQVVVGEAQTKYSMIIVKPDSGVDYKIVQVTPDPNIDYKIVVVDPKSGDELADLSRGLGEAIRENLRQKQKQPGK